MGVFVTPVVEQLVEQELLKWVPVIDRRADFRSRGGHV